EGKTVCRLKGGDPFVFGRGAEEAQVLVNAGVSFEIVPGVSSAIAVPAYAGIPVTHRHHAHAFIVVAGSRSRDLGCSECVAARNLMKAGGIVVVMMGLSRLKPLVDSFLADHCDPETPIAVISNGTWANQDCRVGTLNDIADQVDGLKPPALIVIGEVVS